MIFGQCQDIVASNSELDLTQKIWFRQIVLFRAGPAIYPGVDIHSNVDTHLDVDVHFVCGIVWPLNRSAFERRVICYCWGGVVIFCVWG